MRLVGLDIGEARIGVAVSDAGGVVASPLVVLDARALARDIGPLKRIVEDYEAGGLVVGLPLTLAGEEGPQAVAVREQTERIATALGMEIAYVDERLSSAAAARAMAEAGVSARDRRGQLDMVAAAYILQGYLDTQRRSTPDER
jgi:putative Holliday junction resolvase